MNKLALVLLSVIIFSCTFENKKEEGITEKNQVNTSDTKEFSESKKSEISTNSMEFNALLGYYVGPFVAVEFDENKNGSYVNKINISIDSINDGMLFGHSVVAGNERPFNGKLIESDKGYRVTANEPGDDKYDGKFTFTIDAHGIGMNGLWTANNTSLNVNQRSFELEKKEFVYNQDINLPAEIAWTEIYNNEEEFLSEFVSEEVTSLNASNTVLLSMDVENMYKGDLEIIRNSIYARHGYSFKTRKMRYFFDEFVDWYIPVSTDVRSQITALELANIKLLKRYEKHADRYYDDFSR